MKSKTLFGAIFLSSLFLSLSVGIAKADGLMCESKTPPAGALENIGGCFSTVITQRYFNGDCNFISYNCGRWRHKTLNWEGSQCYEVYGRGSQSYCNSLPRSERWGIQNFCGTCYPININKLKLSPFPIRQPLN